MDLLPFSGSTLTHPFLRGTHWFQDDWPVTERLMNQMFGNELSGPFMHQPFSNVPYWLQPRLVGPDTGVSEVKNERDRFTVNLDVSQFKPEEIQVTMGENNVLTIEGQHEERMDEHGFVSRHFKRRYQLPQECDTEKVETELSHDGVLNITSPKKEAVDEFKERRIPIKGAPAPVRRLSKGKRRPDEEIVNGK